MYDYDREKMVRLSPDIYVKPSCVEIIAVDSDLCDDEHEANVHFVTVITTNGSHCIEFDSLADARQRAEELVEHLNQSNYE